MGFIINDHQLDSGDLDTTSAITDQRRTDLSCNLPVTSSLSSHPFVSVSFPAKIRKREDSDQCKIDGYNDRQKQKIDAEDRRRR